MLRPTITEFISFVWNNANEWCPSSIIQTSLYNIIIISYSDYICPKEILLKRNWIFCDSLIFRKGSRRFPNIIQWVNFMFIAPNMGNASNCWRSCLTTPHFSSLNTHTYILILQNDFLLISFPIIVVITKGT